jgi:hypothetical protein
MLPKNPYQLILEELNVLNDIEDEDTCRAVLQSTQEYVIKLRQGFRASPATVDYSCPHQRAAYLLAYYPHYIEPLFRALNSYTPQDAKDSIFENHKIRACFLGSGPSPEVLGWIAYMNAFATNVENALAYLVDNQDWYTGRILTTYHLSSKYWKGELRTFHISFDLGAECDSLPPVLRRAIARSGLIVMQNCLNEYALQSEAFLSNYAQVIINANPGTLFVVIDLKFPAVLEMMKSIETIAVSQGCQILRNADQSAISFSSEITIPEIILEELLIGNDNLIPKRKTSFYLSTFKKLNEIPF